MKMYSFYNHMYHPRHYGDPVGEYWQLLNGVTLWDVGVERQVEITGPDAFTLANMLVPRDLNKCAVGQCKYVFITASSSPLRTAGSSTTPSCCDWTRTTSATRWCRLSTRSWGRSSRSRRRVSGHRPSSSAGRSSTRRRRFRNRTSRPQG